MILSSIPMELTFPAQLEARMCPLARTAVKRPVLQKTAVLQRGACAPRQNRSTAAQSSARPDHALCATSREYLDYGHE